MNNSEHQRWINDRGDHTHRLNYNLDNNSIVFDLGGYKGEWAQQIFNKYQSNVYIFEPVNQFYETIIEKFKDNKQIKVFKFAAGEKNDIIDINLSTDSSSIFSDGNNKEKIEIKNFSEFLDENNIVNVDLIKINIEGSEYDLLKSLYDNDKLKIFQDIQVQFHDFIPDAINKRDELRNALSKTHNITYDYGFVWENWRRK